MTSIRERRTKMKQLFKRMSIMLIAVAALVCLMPGKVSAASVTYYQTAKADVPIWSAASSSSTQIRKIATTGTVLKVIGSTRNSAGNIWYQLNDYTWVFSGNVTNHYHAYHGGYCTGNSCGYEYPLTISGHSATYTVTNTEGAKIWSRPYSNNSSLGWIAPYGTVYSVVAQTKNADGNYWYQLSNGYWVYSGNVTRTYTVSYNANGGSGAPSAQSFLSGKSVTLSSSKPTRSGYSFKGWSTSSSASSASYTSGKTYSFSGNVNLYAVWKKCSHSSYSGGYCSTCGYEYPISVSSHSGTYVVTNSGGAKIWSRPYSNKSTQISLAAYGSALTVTGKTTNAEKHVWYQLSNGYWVYSKNVGLSSTLTYKANGGSGAPDAQNFVAGSSVKLSSTKPTRSYYIFQGWATSSSATKASYKAGASVAFSGNTTLYAVWKKCGHSSYSGGYCTSCGYEYPISVSSVSGTYIVTNSSGAKIWSRPYSKNSSQKSLASYGSTLTVTGKTTNADKNVWYKLSDGNWVFSGNVESACKLTYKANGGSGAPKAKYFQSGKSLTVSSTKPTRVGYVFKGWGTSKDTSKVSYKSGAAATFKKSTTLYAVWGKCSHSYQVGVCKTCGYTYPYEETKFDARSYVVNNDNGAPVYTKPYSSSSIKVGTKAYNSVLSIVASTKNAQGNTWYKLSDGTWVYSENVTRRYTIKYNDNGGEGAPKTQYLLSGKTLKLSSTKPTRVGYVFQGWGTSKSATKVSYKAGASYSEKKNITLYAIWKKCSHSNYTGGYCTSCNYEAKLEVKSHSATYVVTNKDGAKNWSRPYSNKSTKISVSAKGAVLSVTAKTTNVEGKVWYQLSNGNWVYSGNVTRRYSIKYNANGGSGAPKTQYRLYNGETLKLSTTVPTRSGYVFAGWATSSSATKATYKAGGSYSKNSSVTLYAVWTSCSKHDYSYGICKNCKQEYTLDQKDVNTVYTITNSDGVKTYKRPYQKSSEKTGTLSKGTKILLTKKAVNANGQTWYKLSNGSWISSSNKGDKSNTYQTLQDVTVADFVYLQKGSITAKKFDSHWYYSFTRSGKSVYVNVNAFSKVDNTNSDVSTFNTNATAATNIGKAHSSDFIYFICSSQSLRYDSLGLQIPEVSYKAYTHRMINVTALGGIVDNTKLETKLSNNGAVEFTFHSMVPRGSTFDNTPRNPSTAEEYLACLERSSPRVKLYPEFVVAVTEATAEPIGNGEYIATGYFTQFVMEGNGYSEKSLDLREYINLYTIGKKIYSSAKTIIKATEWPAGALKDIVSGTWDFFEKIASYGQSTEYRTNDVIRLNLDTLPEAYKVSSYSPINLQSSGDYLWTKYSMYEYKRTDQKFSIQLIIHNEPKE